jgi:hypothetical protein
MGLVIRLGINGSSRKEIGNSKKEIKNRLKSVNWQNKQVKI